MLADAEPIFTRYSNDAEVTRYMGWPRHRSPDDTRLFLEFSETEWKDRGVGPYVIESREDGRLIGSTGLEVETLFRAAAGYVLARSEWGRGYATEALRAMVGLAPTLGLRRLHALCHPDHRASWRVLEKCGFEREALLRRHSVLPNLEPDEPSDVLCYVRLFG